MNSRYIIIGNWKMKVSDLATATGNYQKISEAASSLQKTTAVVCPSCVHLSGLSTLTHDHCSLGAQDVFWESAGAYTGMVSAPQVSDAGASYALLGHSELRALGETNDMVAKKLASLGESSLVPVVFIGEQDRDEDGRYLEEVRGQVRDIFTDMSAEIMEKVIVAYEPVWAISTNSDGRVCTPEQCAEMVELIFEELQTLHPDFDTQYLYGGSANRENAAAFLVEGKVTGLVPGSASLDPDHFIELLTIAESLDTVYSE